MASGGPSKPLSLPTSRKSVERPRSRWFDEAGSALAMGVVLLGVFAILFTGSVSHEGAARALNIKTSHRRSALDLAHGAIDELLRDFDQQFDIDDCSAVRSGLDVTATAAAGPDESVIMTAKAGVAGVHETVRVIVEPYRFEDYLGAATIVAGEDLDVELKNNVDGLDVDGGIYVGGDLSVTDNHGGTFDHGPVSEPPVPIPSLEEVAESFEKAIERMTEESGFESRSLGYVVAHDCTTNTIMTTPNPTVSAGQLIVSEDAWLVVDGGFRANGSAELIINGTLIVRGGSININSDAGGEVKVSGSGTIVCLCEDDENRDFNITLGAGERTGLSLISTSAGYVNLTVDYAKVDPDPEIEDSLFVYGNNIDAIFQNADDDIQVDPCSFMSVEDTTIECKDVENVVLRGESFTNPVLPVEARMYRITDWYEGNNPI